MTVPVLITTAVPPIATVPDANMEIRPTYVLTVSEHEMIMVAMGSHDRVHERVTRNLTPSMFTSASCPWLPS